MFNLFGCVGLMRLPDVYNRLQSATKCVTLGTCSILLGVLIRYGFVSIGIKALVAIPLLFLYRYSGRPCPGKRLLPVRDKTWRKKYS
jgi:monovalent cation/proton antiporter MnhG/PhaG subunit